MPQLDFSLLGPPVDFAARVREGAELGRAMVHRQRQENALARLVANPNDGEAVNALASVNPPMAYKFSEDARERQAAAAKAQQDKHAEEVKVIGLAAKAAKDPASWDGVVDALSVQYPEAAQYKGKFDPNLRAALMAQAGIEDKPDNGTTMQQNYEYLKTHNPALAEQYLRNQAEGQPLVIDNGDGTRTIIPRSMIQPSAAPSASVGPVDTDALRAQAEEAIRQGADPVKVKERLEQMLGGAGSGPQTFPGPN